ncbi:MAG: choice-of-anchor J domain-containing protein [Bacteroidaceae bacterium]|nr:choice-of-anchor J domain-containing protein [Bacteroidaceae bacterium]
MKVKYIVLSAFTALFTSNVMGQEECLNVDFFDGIPDNFTLISYDENPVKSQDFKKINTSMEWFISKVVSKDNVAAISTSHRTFDFATDNWMITPRLTLPSENVGIKWTARAMHYHMRDGYKVMISTTGKEYFDFEEIFSVENEEYLWTEHYVSLDKYAGKKVYIAFVHDCKDKFLLAIDDIFVGQSSEEDFIVEDKTPRFVGNVGTTSVLGSVVNSGMKLENTPLICLVNDTLTLTHSTEMNVWSPGEEEFYSFDVPVQVGKATHYKLKVGENTILEDSIICSYFPRTLLLEKATGTWCVNCPEVISFIQEVEERYGSQIVCVEAHWGPPEYGKDPFHYSPYTTGMKVNSYPTVRLNRDSSNPITGGSPAQNIAKIRKMLSKPTIAKIDMELAYEETDTVLTSAKVVFANDLDNSTGKYRVGYILIEKTIQSDEVGQINGVNNETQGEFYYMKSPVPTDLMWYTNVVRNDNNAFLGIKNSLPSAIEAGVEYTVDAKMGIPSSVYDKNNLAIIAVVMNYYTDEVLNVVEVKVPENPYKVGNTSKESTDVNVSLKNGILQVQTPLQEKFSLEVISVDGRQVALLTGEGSGQFDLSQIVQHGLYFLRIRQEGYVWVEKVMF